MRITLRGENNKDYWENRWSSITVDAAMINEKEYPLKFTINTIKYSDKNQKILEAGCGPGRIVKFLFNQGYDVTGIDFINTAINKIKKDNPLLKVSCQSILETDFDNDKFDTILAFGLYHNFKIEDVILSLKETTRILKKGGLLCFSFRLDNIQNLILDKLKDKKNSSRKHFHKLNLKEEEILNILKRLNFEIIQKEFVTNMPLLFHFKIFREKKQKIFNEHIGRTEGYKLNFVGKIFNWILINFFRKKYSNIIVITCKKI
jgi:SAM-dependent methyltransferase